MKADQIKQILEAYYDGQTSDEEEQLLLRYFQGDNVDIKLLEEKELFLELHKSQPIVVPSALESKLDKLIDHLAEKEVADKSNLQTGRRHLFIWAISAAAGVALLLSAGIYFNKKEGAINSTVVQQNTSETITETDKEKLKEAQEALQLLSSKFNKGLGQVATLSTNLDKTNEMLNKALNRTKNKKS